MPTVQTARSTGAGSLRFFARSVADALAGGSRLAALEESERPDGGCAVDFVLARAGGAAREVVRVLFDRRGRPTTVESWVIDEPAPRRDYNGADALVRLLSERTVTGLRVESDAVALAADAGQDLVLRFDDFRDLDAS